MNFIKNIINGKKHEAESMNAEDVAALIEDVQSDENSSSADFSKLAEIQSKIKRENSEDLEPEYFAQDDMEEAEIDTAPVSDFADVVKDIKTEDAPASVGETVLSPVMTEEDFEKLDDELARMSEELEELEEPKEPEEPGEATSNVVVDEAESETSVEMSSAPSAPETLASENQEFTDEISVEMTIAAEAATARTSRKQQELSRIYISELQGGGSYSEASQETEKQAPTPNAEAASPNDQQPEPVAPIIEVPSPASGRSDRRAGRVKTRLLGFEPSDGKEPDPFEKEDSAVVSAQVKFPVGWMMIVDGPGFGTTFVLFNGVSQIGRGDDQAIRLDFGDNCISRENHAAVAYDADLKKFFLGHGGKANLVRLNSKPVLSTEEIVDADIIRIGETTLRFVALCGQEFSWETRGEEEQNDAAIA